VSQAFILTLALMLARAFIGPASTWQGSGSGEGIPHPIFVRQFASAQDIKRAHPNSESITRHHRRSEGRRATGF
jgi:hypothetical protein